MREKGAVGARLGPEPLDARASSAGVRRGPEPEAWAWGPLPGGCFGPVRASSGPGSGVMRGPEPEAWAWGPLPGSCFEPEEATLPSRGVGFPGPLAGGAGGTTGVPPGGVRRAAGSPPVGVPHSGCEPCRGVGVPGRALVPVTRMPTGGVGARTFGAPVVPGVPAGGVGARTFGAPAVPGVPVGGVGVRGAARAKAAASAGAADLRPPGISALSSWRSSSSTSALHGSWTVRRWLRAPISTWKAPRLSRRTARRTASAPSRPSKTASTRTPPSMKKVPVVSTPRSSDARTDTAAVCPLRQ